MSAARLEVRRPGSYRVPWARRAPWIAAGGLGVLTVLRLSSGSMPRLFTWALFPVGLVKLAATIGVWQRYGSARPGTRPNGREQAT